MKWRNLKVRAWRVLANAFDHWVRADCTTQAAAVSFYAALSLFPFVIVLISGIGLFFEVFESGQNAEETVLTLLSEVFSPEMSQSVGKILQGIQDQARVTGPIASLVLVYLGSRVFTQIDTAFEHIWDVRNQKRGFRGTLKDWAFTRMRSIALIGGFGAVGIMIFFGSTLVYTAESLFSEWFPDAKSVWGLRTYVISVFTNAIVFGGLYRFMAKRPTRWKLCFGTGLLVAVLWEVGRIILASLVIGERYTALGVAGSFLGILLWIFYNNLALFLGAVLIRSISSKHGDPTPDQHRSPPS